MHTYMYTYGGYNVHHENIEIFLTKNSQMLWMERIADQRWGKRSPLEAHSGPEEDELLAQGGPRKAGRGGTAVQRHLGLQFGLCQRGRGKGAERLKGGGGQSRGWGTQEG